MSSIQEREILESWKEIAYYLNRTVKTCQRWEQELDLPIRRLDGTSRARVFAYRDEIDFWLEDKLNSREISTTKYLRIAKKKPKRLWIALPAALVLIIIAVVATRILPHIDFISPPPEKPHLAILPIKNYTGDESHAHWEDALTNLIVNDLYQSKFIRVMTAERMNQILEDMNKLDADSYTTEDLKRIASLDGVTHFLSGAATKFGEKIRLNISIQKAGSWETTWSDYLDGTVNEMFAMVDVLTRTLKPHLNLTTEQIDDDFDKAVAEVTTPNERALQFYIQARRAMNDTEWNLAIELFQRAIALDPDFAMAYRFLSGVCNHLGLTTGEGIYWEKLDEYGKKAREAAQRRPPSERERLIIEGTYIDKVSDEYPDIVAQEIETFKKLLELYPDDDYGNYRLGTRYFQAKAYDRAEKLLKRIVGFTSSSFTLYILSKIYLDQERYTDAEDVLKLGLERFPNNLFMYQRMAQLHALQNEFDEALLWCERGFEVEPIQFRDSLVKGDVLFFKGDFSAAEGEYRSCLNSENKKTWMNAATNLMYLYKTQGRFEDAWAQAEEAKRIPSENVRLNFNPVNIELIRLNARIGNIQEALAMCDEVDLPTGSKLQGETYVWAKLWPEAEKVLLEVEEILPEYDRRDWPMYLAQNDLEGPFRRRIRNAIYSIGAKLALDRGDYAQAITYMEQAKTLYPGPNLIPADLIELLGEGHYRSGDLESAREQFERITRMTYSRKEHGDIYAKSFYMLGKIFEQMGKKRDARKNYERFLDLWKNADPGLPEVDDARSRLAALQ